MAPLGRPRSFDVDKTLDQAVEAFWRFGMNGSTTRTLEAELGVTQSSIYNAFGSKAELATQVLDRYVEQLEEGLVSLIDDDDAGFDEFETFLTQLVDWISNEQRPGCLLLNISAEEGTADVELVERSKKYRLRLRELFANLLTNEGVANPAPSADLILAAVLGMNVSARAGAERDEINLLANGLRSHMELLARAAS